MLNIFGPAIGITCAILILLYVREELTYDRQNKKYDRIYRLESDFNISGKATLAALVPMPMAPALKDEYPEIKEVTRFAGFGVQDILFQYKDLKFFEDNLYFTDSTVFELFDYEFILGSPENALNEPNTIVITESFASKYFGNIDMMHMKLLEGKNFTIRGKHSYSVRYLPVYHTNDCTYYDQFTFGQSCVFKSGKQYHQGIKFS